MSSNFTNLAPGINYNLNDNSKSGMSLSDFIEEIVSGIVLVILWGIYRWCMKNCSQRCSRSQQKPKSNSQEEIPLQTQEEDVTSPSTSFSADQPITIESNDIELRIVVTSKKKPNSSSVPTGLEEVHVTGSQLNR